MPLTLPIFLLLVPGFVVVGVYLERKVSAFIQDRLGPMEVGKWGLLQLIADLLKLLQKEDIVPKAADRTMFLAAPIVIFVAIFTGYAVLPLNNWWQGSATNLGVYFLLTIISIDIIGILMAGWGSNNKYSMLGAVRSVAQIVSYEIPLGFSVLCVTITAQTLDLQQMSFQQGIFAQNPVYLFGITDIDITKIGGFLSWNIIQSPFLIPVYVIFFITTLAEANRAPFDLPEGESELIGGFHTEYSGMRWALIMLSEYGMMLLVSFLGAILFWGGWNSPLPNIGSLRLADWTSGTIGSFSAFCWGFFWLFTKALFAVMIQMWVRWTFPRLRIDQLMYLCWKVLIPAITLLFVLCAVWRLAMN